MAVLLADAAAVNAPSLPAEEIDVWWGSYAGRAMAPSFALCVCLTALIYFGARWWVPERGWLQLTFSALTTGVWLVQLARWARRFFFWNYRLTTRFLYLDCGLHRTTCQRFAVQTIDRVEIRTPGPQRWLGIGDIWVWFGDTAELPVALKALANPRAAADTIREVVRKARAHIN